MVDPEAAARWLHDEQCNDGDTRTCGRWVAGSNAGNKFYGLHWQHVKFYRDMALGMLRAAGCTVGES